MQTFFVLTIILLTELFLFQVNIQVPAPDQQSDNIYITGLASQLDRAKEGLLERVKELQAEQEDRVNICHVCLNCMFFNEGCSVNAYTVSVLTAYI